MGDEFEVEVVYASPAKQQITKVVVPAGSTILTAIQLSGILNSFPEIDLNCNPVGIFADIKSLNYKVHAGDRVEIYRDLYLDPKLLRLQKIKESS